MTAAPITFHPRIGKRKPIDILLAYPTPTEDSPFNLTPLSILYPGALFESQGKRVEYWDGRWDSWEMLEDLIRDSSEVGVSAFTGKQCARAAEILERVKQIDSKILTHLGGHHARLCTQDVKKEPNVDQVWPERSYGEDLFPFSPAAQRLWKRGDVQMITSTGCPYNCTFCALRSAWNPRDLDKFEREVDAIYDLTGFKEVSFSDPNIGYNKYRLDGVTHRVDRLDRMRGIGKILRKHDIKWDGNVRADYIDQEYADTMAWAGCTSIEFGLESGDDEFLKHGVKKGHDVRAGLTANSCMARTPISVMNSFVRGMPFETHEQWIHTMEHIDAIMEIAPNARASVYKYTPYPGCPSYDDAVAGRGIEKFDPPKTMREWGERKLMVDAVYWCTGMCFRMDNTTKNFQGADWAIIEPYVQLARKLWKERRPEDFPGEEVEKLVTFQVRKHLGKARKAA